MNALSTTSALASDAAGASPDEAGNWRPPETRLPSWGVADLPEPMTFAWLRWRGLLGPGIVMMGVQIGGG
ncbi:MAG: hypothetical protein IT424_15010, partial [Pirellulales bacterium]|nr:hypothetical protein [Pirellulales bacterium]